MKRTLLVTSILSLLLVPAWALAGTDAFTANKALPSSGDDVVVPLDVTNSKPLVALDIPLQFSDGATLVSVDFTDRVASFQFKNASIDQANRQVVIGLISMMASEAPDLAPGSGPVANLHFKLAPGVNGVQVNTVELTKPDHNLAFYYNDYSSGRPEVKSIQPDAALGAVVQSENVPKTYMLSQNSPNPFNPTTKISFALPATGNVRLSVFNVLGQQVKELVNGAMDAGVHEVIWDGKDNNGTTVASGIYFYKINANNFVDTKKMVLLK
jgi:molybdopterin-binding protein